MSDDDVPGDEGVDLLRWPPFRRTAADEDYASVVEARSCMDMAVGIVMGKHDCTRSAALVRLQRIAAQFDITTLELAKALVAGSGTSTTT